MDNTQMDKMLNGGIDFSDTSMMMASSGDLEELAKAGFDKKQAKTIISLNAADLALSYASGIESNEELADFVNELDFQVNDYSIDARFEAVPDRNTLLDRLKNYVGTSIEDMKTAFDDKRFARAALAGAKVGSVNSFL